jgi:catechol 2,3-dioxygenase-like lactoylglutathione lyase family enzyme
VRLNHVLLPCTDVARSLAFYEGLGLTAIVVDRAPDGTPWHARLVFPDGGATLSLESGRVVSPGIVVYFECAGLGEKVAALGRAGYIFAEPLQMKPWLWREAALVDPDGYRLCLFQAGSYRLDPPGRLFSSPLSVENTDRKPGSVEFSVESPIDFPLDSFLAVRNRGYIDAALPSARDAQMGAYLEQLIARGAASRDQAASLLGPAYTTTFLAYAERMASLGAREQSERSTLLGLFAVALIWRACADVTAAIPVLGLLYDAVKRAGAVPDLVFEAAAALAPADVAAVLRDFLTRGDLDEIAAEMGFAEGRDRDGFRYRRLWGAGQVDLDP